MGAKTKIEWCDHTFNWVWGCSHVSAGCDHCYAEAYARRWGFEAWGGRSSRRLLSDANWRQPLRWNREAERAGVRRRVFCGSMMDWCDPLLPQGERERGWALIRLTPWLDWLMLTKRPELMGRYLPPDWGDGYENVGLGVSAETQALADRRVWVLGQTPARMRFVSGEPQLEALDVERYLGPWDDECYGPDVIHWWIVGGESGPHARPFDVAWARAIVEQCRGYDEMAVFVKQLGSRPTLNGEPLALRDAKGGDMDEWPEDLRVRQFPL